jgi:streptogramin lyase
VCQLRHGGGGHAVSVETDRLVGTDLAGYRLESVLGRGGMGIVYLATDLRLERKVAVKLVAPELAADPRFRERFLRESRLAASLDHSHIVPVHAAGETDGHLWIAMRYVPGTDLRTLLDAQGPLEPARAVELVSQIGEALDAAHAHGLIHRDVKPANVLVTEEGGEEHCYLADFGLARTADLDAVPGTGANLSGTVDYTSPEQIAGNPLDGRADVYSLGCVFYECLVGQPPYRRRSQAATVYAHLEDEAPSLHERRPDLPEAVDSVIDQALAKDAGERYETCGDLVQAAREALGLGKPRFTRRQLVLAGTAAAIAVAAAAAVPAILLSRGEEAAAPKPILPLADTSLVRIDPDSAELVFAVGLGGAPTQVATGLGSVWIVDPREQAVKEIDPTTNTLVRAIDVTGAGPPIWVTAGDDVLWLEAYGKSIATTAIWRLEPDTGSLSHFADTWLAPGMPPGRSLWLVNYEEADTVAEVEIDTRRVLDTIRVPRASSNISMSASPQAVWITYQDAPDVLKRLDPATGELVAEIQVGPVETILEGDGEVWVATNDGSVSRIDPATNEVTDTIEGVTRSPKHLVLGGGSLWVGDARDPVVAQVDPETGDVITTRVGGIPLHMAFGEGGVWVLVRPS